MRDEPAVFRAILAPLQSAVQVHGSGDGMRIRLDIPATEMAEAVKLIAWGQKVLMVTIEPESLTEFNDAAKESPEGGNSSLGRRRIGLRRDK